MNGIDNEDLYHLYMLYSLHGQSKDALAKNQLGAWEYNIAAPWFKCNMTDVHAAIGLGQIRRYDQILARKKEMIEKYDEAFSTLPIDHINHYTDDYCSSGHLYIMRMNHKDGIPCTRAKVNSFIVKLAEADIATNVHYKPLPLHTGYQNLGFLPTDYPECIKMFSNEVTLPLHTVMSDEDVDYVIENVKAVYGELFE